MLKRGWAAATIFLVGIIILGIGVRWALQWPGRMAAKSQDGIREAISEVFVDLLHVRPEIKEGTKVRWGQTSARTEVVVAERRVEVEYEWEHVWLGSKKMIRLRQEYGVKAGFDLEKPFQVEVGSVGQEVVARLPAAEILATTPLGAPGVKGEDGWWNKVTDHDREVALAKLTSAAKERAVSCGILEEAEQLTQGRLQNMARAKGIRLKLDFPRAVSPP